MSNIIDFIVIGLFLFMGIKYIKTRQFDDKKNIYTEESKEKAALIAGVLFLFIAAVFAITTLLRFKGIIGAGTDFVVSIIPYIAIIVFTVIVFIIIYKVVLKKK